MDDTRSGRDWIGGTASGCAAMVAAAMLWGTTGTAQELGSSAMEPGWVGAWRLAIASLCFAAVVLATRGPAVAMADLRGMSGVRVLAAGVCMAVYNLAFFAGVKAAGVAVGTAVAIGSGPLWAALLQRLGGGAPASAGWWAGTLSAVAGVALLVSGAGDDGSSPRAVGVLLCLSAGLGYAAYALVSHRLVATSAPASVTLAVFATAAAIALPLARLGAGPLDAAGLPAAAWATVVYLGVVATGVAYLLFSAALRHVAGATGVTLALAEPLTAFVLAIAVVGERPPAAAYGGLALLVAGLVWVVRAETRGRR